MEAFGLPAAFGKPQQAATPTVVAEEQPVAGPSTAATRGGSSGRGDRGVVGGGKRNKRGRGRGGHSGEADAVRTEWDKGSAGLASQFDAFNGGVKRSFNSDQARPPPHESIQAQPMSHQGRGRGGHRGRGRGGGLGGGGSDRGRGGFVGQRRNDTLHGPYLKSSMWADPWEDLLKTREAGKV